jgi:hypothetical protein
MEPQPLAEGPRHTPELPETVHEVSQSRWKWPDFVRKLLREPLVHFLLAGAMIFAIYGLLHPNPSQIDRAHQIVLTKDDLRQLATHWLAQGRTPPTADQMRRLIEQKVDQEILSREALTLGLDKGDEIIKRRLTQKMGFLAEDVAALHDPSNDELRAWFAQNSDRFALPPRLSFRHLYFSFDRPDAHDRAAAGLDKIGGRPSEAAEVATIGDPFMFQNYYAERSPEQVAKEFGRDFANAVFRLKPDGWQGPIESGYGWHLVFVDAIELGRVPAFEEVEPEVKSAWLDQKQREVKETALEAMRARYTVLVPPIETVDWASLRNQRMPIATDVFPQ